MPRVVSSSQLRSVYAQSFANVPRVQPFWTVDLSSEDAVATWIQDALSALVPNHSIYCEDLNRKRDFWAGLQSLAYGRYNQADRNTSPAAFMQSKITANRIMNITELWVAKITRYTPNVVINPANTEYQDKVSSKLAKLIADNIAYQDELDLKSEEYVRLSRMLGESYLFFYFDKTLGDYDKKMTPQEATELGVRVPVMTDDGQPVMGIDGEQLFVDTRQRIGEARSEVVHPKYVILEPREKYSEADYCFRAKIMYVDEVRAKYPNAEDIEAGNEFGYDTSWLALADNQVVVWEFEHRSTEFLDSGASVVYCQGQVLEMGPYRMRAMRKSLPCVRYSAIDVPGYQRGMSTLDNLLVLQVIYNNLFSLAYNNISLGAHAYWLVPQSANFDVTKIRNSSSILKFTGPTAPRLETFRTLGPEVLTMVAKLEELMTIISGHQGISSGETPPGVDAAVALGLLEEQEQQRANPEIKKWNAVVKKIYQHYLGLAQDNYKRDDGRLIRIVGKNNQDTIKAIDLANFVGPYDVRVVRSTALSESKSLRMQQLVQIRQNFPNAVSDAQFIEMMELADEQRLYDTAAASVKAAQYENERMFGGELILPPAKYENHFDHWATHNPFIAQASFKEDTSEEIKTQAFEHILVHESFMFDQALSSPATLQRLMALPDYPKFFNLPIPLAKVAAMQAQGLDVAAMLQDPEASAMLAQAMPGAPMGAPGMMPPGVAVEGPEPLPQGGDPLEATMNPPQELGEPLPETSQPDAPGSQVEGEEQ